jgi:hypothetical protein
LRDDHLEKMIPAPLDLRLPPMGGVSE